MHFLSLGAVSLTALCGVFGWETVQDAARLSRKLVNGESIATLATVYPSDYREPGLANHPFALMEYYAECHTNGSLTYLFFPISQNARNVASSTGKTASFTVRAGDSAVYDGSFTPDVGSAYPDSPDINQVPLDRATLNAGWWSWSKSLWGNGGRSTSNGRGPAAAARVALMGNVKIFHGVTGEGDTEADREARQMSDCFLAKHPDAKWWVPGRPGAPHVAWWARFDPLSIYYVGGFGSEHYIGWIPAELYRNSSSSRIYF